MRSRWSPGSLARDQQDRGRAIVAISGRGGVWLKLAPPSPGFTVVVATHRPTPPRHPTPPGRARKPPGGPSFLSPTPPLNTYTLARLPRFPTQRPATGLLAPRRGPPAEPHPTPRRRGLASLSDGVDTQLRKMTR